MSEPKIKKEKLEKKIVSIKFFHDKIKRWYKCSKYTDCIEGMCECEKPYDELYYSLKKVLEPGWYLENINIEETTKKYKKQLGDNWIIRLINGNLAKITKPEKTYFEKMNECSTCQYNLDDIDKEHIFTCEDCKDSFCWYKCADSHECVGCEKQLCGICARATMYYNDGTAAHPVCLIKSIKNGSFNLEGFPS